MSIPSNITVSQDVIFKEIDGEAVLLDLRSEKYFGLGGVGTRLWQLLTENSDTTAALTQLLSEYDVDESILCQDLANLISELENAGLVSSHDE